MKSKLCGDKDCRRFGVKLRACEFPKNRARSDGLHTYCKECSLRRTHETRNQARAFKQAQKALQLKPEVEQKPLVLAPNKLAFSIVYDAIGKGLRTRQAIRRETGLDYDSIGEALVELVYDCKAVKIEKREYHLAARSSVEISSVNERVSYSHSVSSTATRRARTAGTPAVNDARQDRTPKRGE